MNVTLPCLLCIPWFILPPPPQTDELDPGIYEVLPAGEGKSVTFNGGQQVDLGKRLPAKLGKAEIWSTSNANDRFRLSLMVDEFESGDAGRLAICAGKVCVIVSSRSNQQSETVALDAHVTGEEAANRLGAAFNALPKLRKHPGHLLLVRWTPTKDSFAPDEPVKLRLKLTNVGNRPVRFMAGGQQRGARDNQFGFTAYSNYGFGPAVPDAGDPRNFGGKAMIVTLKPAESFTKEVDLAGWFKFKNKDFYQITATYELELYDADQTSRPIWHEFVTGRCVVRRE